MAHTHCLKSKLCRVQKVVCLQLCVLELRKGNPSPEVTQLGKPAAEWSPELLGSRVPGLEMIWSRGEVEVGMQHQGCGSQMESTTPTSEPPLLRSPLAPSWGLDHFPRI